VKPERNSVTGQHSSSYTTERHSSDYIMTLFSVRMQTPISFRHKLFGAFQYLVVFSAAKARLQSFELARVPIRQYERE
jgi:hypothetical protein